MQRIHVLGSAGSGKSTFARKLGERLGIPYIELDEYYWLPQWSWRADDDVIALVQPLAAGRNWVIDGNYSFLQPTIWQHVDTVVWLDLPLHVCLWRCFRRGIKRCLTREVVCNGNTESFGRLFSRKSLLWWILTTHRQRRRRIAAWIENARTAQPHIRVHVVKSNRQANALLP